MSEDQLARPDETRILLTASHYLHSEISPLIGVALKIIGSVRGS
jgi:hypothetical protein